MEAAPLTLAHSHARNASIETKRSNPVAASEEHDLAAAEYATAAQGSSDSEAIRILNLLEQQHRRLGQIIKSRHEKPVVEDVEPRPATREASAAAMAAETIKQPEPGRSTSPDATAGPPRLSRASRPNARDLSSSIASNLASARGIPSTRQKRSAPISPLVSNQHADGLFTQEKPNRKTISRNPSAASPVSTQRPSWAPPLAQDEETTASPQAQAADAPFQQFYNTFESLLSKLSAPLAFAGLPLTSTPSSKAEIVTAQDSPKPFKTPRLPETSPSMDYSQLISRAALRAVNSNTPGSHSSNPSESFYVVPTTGGTISYAEIMNRADREDARPFRERHRHTSNLSNVAEDDFVDARSTILPDRGNTRTGTGNRRGMTNEPKVNGKTMEELALENEALKHLSDRLSRRLHVFEMSSQTSTAALAQSIRSMPRSPLATPEHSRNKNTSKPDDADSKSRTGNDRTNARIEELEQILKNSDAKARRREEENAKLRETLGKYREKWDSLKAGAKARREGQREQTQGHGGAAKARSAEEG